MSPSCTFYPYGPPLSLFLILEVPLGWSATERIHFQHSSCFLFFLVPVPHLRGLSCNGQWQNVRIVLINGLYFLPFLMMTLPGKASMFSRDLEGICRLSQQVPGIPPVNMTMLNAFLPPTLSPHLCLPAEGTVLLDEGPICPESPVQLAISPFLGSNTMHTTFFWSDISSLLVVSHHQVSSVPASSDSLTTFAAAVPRASFLWGLVKASLSGVAKIGSIFADAGFPYRRSHQLFYERLAQCYAKFNKLGDKLLNVKNQSLSLKLAERTWYLKLLPHVRTVMLCGLPTIFC